MRKIALLSTVAGLAVGFANDTAAPRVAPELTGVATIKLPERVSPSRGSTSLYDFDKLTEVGMSFGVKNKDVRGMSSIISNQNKKHKVNVTDDNGNTVYHDKELKAADGTVTLVPDTARPKTTFTKKFEAREVTADITKLIKGTALDGAKVIVTRIA